ncbi:MAG: HupE/UreJ family protein [Casimicrobiaceae bacterium]
MSPNRALARVGAISAPLIVAVLCSFVVHAHEGAATAFAHVIISGQTVRYSLTLADAARVSLFPSGPARPPAEAFDLLAQAVSQKVRLTNNAAACAPGAARVIPPAASSRSITVVVDFVCRRDVRVLTIRDDLPDVLGADLHTLAKLEWPGGTGQFAFAAESREARFDLGDGAPVTRGVDSFFGLGIEHILTGYDHLLFLLALVLGGGGSWSLLKIITAFTAAHSITLALAVLGIVSLPERFVEAAIALSIAYVAAENLMPKYAVTPRWMVSFLFGLVHGFGFSSVLRTLGLPTENLFWALGAFNLGVEAGQAVIVLPLAAVLLWLRGKPWEPKLVAAVSAIVLTVGLALFVERVVFAGPAVAG